jgi:FAD-dependent oxidoreductase domain-containing protein 1
MTHFNVAIVGGGVVGSSVAYHLKKHGYKGRIGIVERDTTYQNTCTARSLGGIRQQFSTPENIALSTFGLNFIRNLKNEFGPDADVGFKEQGYLILASATGTDTLNENHQTQIANGADNIVLNGAELGQRFPWLNSDGLAAGCLGQKNEGWFDPYALMTLLRKSALAQGVELIVGEVANIESAKSLTLTSGEKISFDILVNAAGAGAGALAAMTGVDLPVHPAKRYVFVLDCQNATEALHKAPLTVDISGVYMRPEGRNFLCGLSPQPDEEPTSMDWDVDHSWFESRIWEPLALRIPQFEALKVINSWVGYYDYNGLDQNAVFGSHPEISNFIFANGFSGHGIQQGPASGNAVAELICYGEYRTIDLKRFGYDRIRDNKPLFEKNVI